MMEPNSTDPADASDEVSLEIAKLATDDAPGTADSGKPRAA